MNGMQKMTESFRLHMIYRTLPQFLFAEATKVCAAVKYAIDVGYRHFDCAYLYGNEKEIGQANAAKISEGIVTREELFVTSKLWNTFHSRAKVAEGVAISLKRLSLDYLDLFLIHFPMGYKEGRSSHPGSYSDVDYLETWKALEDVVDSGKVRAIGISNFNVPQTKRILDHCRIRPLCNQIEVNVYLQNRALVDFCAKNHVAVVAYAPLGGEYAEVGSDLGSPLADPVVHETAQKYGKTPAQILIKFLLQQNLIAVPKSVTKSRIKQNFDVFDFTLEEPDMSCLRALDKGQMYRSTAMLNVCDHKYYPFHAE
ncbi:1,5-anhydro-D-fructose reductase-like isoform X2 [Paramacrobiotus metropolitanus]|uniref:1,5-anhydro-D-fructose reductase-like isoform X2 n=1 Tax=Paramacrobiotus metropolitanus TaxID=2943436 RepID=UPI00244577E4|nr:1,5-anhydro-D-fructose reductase-like isoform X2 [Paramacrobiotus metropolitanus]